MIMSLCEFLEHLEGNKPETHRLFREHVIKHKIILFHSTSVYMILEVFLSGGDVDIVKWLWKISSEEGFKIDINNEPVDRSFNNVCSNGNIEMSQWLWDLCISENVETTKLLHSTLFNNVCSKGHFDMVKWLYNLFMVTGVCFDEQDILESSCEGGNLELVKWVLETFEVDLASSHCDAYSIAIMRGNLEVAKYMRDIPVNGSVCQCISRKGDFGKCCGTGNLDICKWLWEIYKEDEHIIKSLGHYVEMCCIGANLKMVQFLWNLWNPQNIEGSNHLIFYRAHSFGNDEVAEWIVGRYKDTTCLVNYLRKDITTVGLYKKGEVVVAMGVVINSGNLTNTEAEEMYLEDTLSLRKQGIVKKPIS